MSGYDTDLCLWSAQQASLLRRVAAGERVNDQVDWENVAEEIEALGRSDKRELRNRIGTILFHLMKLQASPATEPRGGWRHTVFAQRAAIRDLLRESPSLGRAVAEALREKLPDARALVADSLANYGEQPLVDLASLNYTEDQVLGPWLP
jgi:hypothetical protein